MNDPKKAVAPPAKQVHPVLRESLQPERTQHRLLIRYFRIMRRDRVYPLRVHLQRFNAARGMAEDTTPVTLRPLVPGAEVTPSELSLDASKAGQVATFYITPMAKGSLGGPRVQLLSNGQVVQEVGVPMKSVTQRLTWLLAALTILVPVLLLYATKYNRIVPAAPMELKGPADPNKPGGEQIKLKVSRAGVAGGAAQGGGANSGPTGPNSGGDVIEGWFKENVPPTPNDILAYPGKAIGTVYDYACNMANVYLSFYVGAFLLAATIISWALHLRRPARRHGEPVVLPA